jgi:quinohemoprotein ethanol dehydrogenase
MKELPPKPGSAGRPIEAPVLEASEDTLRRGRDVYSLVCARCHGVGVEASGLYPDLRYASKDVFTNWKAIVLGGAFAGRGMASFADVVSAEDADAIMAYVASRAHHEPGWLEWFGKLAAGRVQVPSYWLAD